MLVADGAAEVRRVLVPVYEALGLDWDPDTTGSVSEEAPGTGIDAVEAAIVAALANRYDVVEAEIDRDTLSLAETFAGQHEAPG